MNVRIIKVDICEKEILDELLEKYNYEFSQYDKRELPQNARYGYKYLDNYFTDNDRYEYFIFCDNKLAGFALIRQNLKGLLIGLSQNFLLFITIEDKVLQLKRLDNCSIYIKAVTT